MNLNLGCGQDVRAGWVNVDRAPLAGVDLVHDLDVHPWPLDADVFDEVLVADLFEHVLDPLGFMSDLWRVMKEGGVAEIRGPRWDSPDLWTDPTHRRGLTTRTFDYWRPGAPLNAKYGEAYAAGCHFDILNVAVHRYDLTFTLRKVAA